MIAVPKSDNTGLTAMQQRRLHRDLDRFKARVAQSRLSQTKIPSLEGDGAEFFAEQSFARGGMHISHRVQQEMTLPQNRFPDNRMGVTMSSDAKARVQFEIPVTLAVPNITPLGSFPHVSHTF